jgi:iron complex outermembrane receptor protein
MPVTAARAEESQVDLSSLSIEDLLNIEVTSASKKVEKIADAPASVYVITRDDLERYGYKTVSEALRRIVGLYVSSDRNYDYLGVRGYARPGDYSTRILLLVDGLRINDPICNSAPIGDDLSLDIRSIQRIEIVKGPGSALWGTNAVLAVINLITRRGSDIEGSRFAQSFTSDSGKVSFFEYGSKNPNGIEIAGSVTSLDSKGEDSIYFPDMQLTATGVDDSSAQCGYLSASYNGFSLLVITGKYIKTIPTGSYGTVFNDSRNRTNDSRTIAALSYERNVCPKIGGNLYARLYSNSYDYDGDYVYDMDYPTPAIDKDTGSAKWWGGEARFSGEISSKLSFVSGTEYSRVKDMRLLNYYADPYYYVNLDTNSSSTLNSYYLQASYDMSKSLRILAGTRMDDYSTYGRSWSPRGALIQKLNDSSTLKMLWGKAFRAPDGYECDYTKAITGNPDSGLIPEEITTTELVWDKALSSSARLVTSAYRYDLENIITQVDDVEFQNSGTVRSEGIESQIDYRLPDGSTAYVNATALKATDMATHQRISNSPRWLAGAGMCIPVLSDRFYLTPEMQLIGSRKTIAGNETGASTVINLTLSTQKAAGGWNISIKANNLFNATCYIPGAYEHTQDRIPQEGRTIQLETSCHF